MSRSKLRGRRMLAIASALAVSVSLPATALATDRARMETPSIRASVARIAAIETERLTKTGPPAARAANGTADQTGSNQNLESGSFFKTPAGVAVLAAFGAGVAYALYSSSNDRIRSSGR